MESGHMSMKHGASGMKDVSQVRT